MWSRAQVVDARIYYYPAIWNLNQFSTLVGASSNVSSYSCCSASTQTTQDLLQKVLFKTNASNNVAVGIFSIHLRFLNMTCQLIACISIIIKANIFSLLCLTLLWQWRFSALISAAIYTFEFVQTSDIQLFSFLLI